MQNLNVTIIQKDLIWEDVSANLGHLDKMIKKNPPQTDLLILPEMFTTGFSMAPSKIAETMDGSGVQWMKKMSQELNAVLCGSLIIKEKDKYFNRLIWMRPDGTFDSYDKRHLFTLADEHKYYDCGNSRLITEWRGWKICPLICYDLRFPVWARNTEGYDLLLYVANWPETRIAHWQNLLRGRAVENQSYTIGVNRVGIDGTGKKYSGHSAIIDFNGLPLYEGIGTEDIFTLSLNKENLNQYRERFQFLKDQDKFEIK